MFITNNRVKLPSEIPINSKITVKVLKTFKLLGIIFDNKLDFNEHCSNLKKIINRKLFRNRRLFHLSNTVKIQFFKTFILLYFDYCLSLIIYFTKPTFLSLNNCFNICIYKLFKFTPDKYIIDDEKDFEIKMEDFLKKLQSYSLLTLQSRILTRL